MIVATLLTAFPICAAAEETLPKSEDGYGAQTENADAALTNYDSLYVGANGEKTAQGGRLLGLYTAFGTDKNGYDLAAGKWFNKMDATGATDAILRDTSDAVSFIAGENGGLAYRMDVATWLADTTKLGVTLPAEWADEENFTVEQVSRLDAIENGGERLLHCHSAMRLDLLLGLWFPSNGAGEHEWYCFRWSTGVTQDWGDRKTDVANYEKHLRDAYIANNGKTVAAYSRYTKRTSDTSVFYGVAYADASYEKEAFTLAGYGGLKEQAGGNAMPIFSLFNGTPGEFYAVRVYNCALTEAEVAQNRFADLASYFGLDLSGYLALTASEQSQAKSFIVENYRLSSAKALLQDTLDAFCKKGDSDGDDLLYVTDGLTYLLTAYSAHSTGFFDNGGTLLWKNGYGLAPATTMQGKGWQINTAGGATMRFDAKDWVFDQVNFGIVLPSSVLPKEEYTVEWVFDPIGLTEEKSDGTVGRFLDETSENGTFVKLSIAIGALRALQFVCYRPVGKDGQMERRWYYNATGDIRDNGWKYDACDKSWEGLPEGDIKTLAVTHRREDKGGSLYTMYSDHLAVDDMTVGADKYKTPEEAGSAFRLMMGMPGTAYAVRVYDRALTDSERAQNHMADLVYFYGLDASRMLSFMNAAGALEGMFDGFADIDFTLTKEEAQIAFDKAVGKALLRYDGVGLRKDATALRYYFSVNTVLAAALTAKGCTLEIGSIVNVNKSTAPLLAGENYDYNIVSYDSKGGRNKGFFVDDDTFALSVLYDNADRITSLANTYVRGYIRLVDAEGEELVMYLDPEGADYEQSCLFNVCYAMQDHPAVADVAGMKSAVRDILGRGYENVTVYLQAGAPTGGDGTKDAPYRGFHEALAACKAILARASRPISVTLMMGDGEYAVYDPAAISGADMPLLYSELHIASQNGKSTLTTTKDIDVSGFSKHADNIWVCQLDKENGKYPAFRTLYVDGKMADVSYSSDRHSFDPAPFATRYSYDFDAPAQKAMDMALSGTLTEDTAGIYPTRPDLEASFRAYVPVALAWIKARTMRLDGKLTADSVITDEDTAYASDTEGRAAYEAAFLEMRDIFMKLASHNIDLGQITSLEAFKAGKQYFDIRIVECFRDDMDEAKAALVKKANAGDSEAKAALADESWRRTALRHLGVEMHLSGQWWQYILHLSGIDFDDTITHEDGTVHVACYRDVSEGYHPTSTTDKGLNVPSASMANRYYCFRNAYEYLDAEGEYYYDRSTGKLYYYTEGGVKDKHFAHATNDYLLKLTEARNLYFEGVRFTGTDDYDLSENGAATGLYGVEDTKVKPLPDYAPPATNFYVSGKSAVFILGCDRLSFTDCVFEELSTKGIHGELAIKNVTVENCSFHRIGSSGVYFGAHTAFYNEEWNVVRDTQILNCYFDEIALNYYTAAAVHMGQNIDCRVMYNTVENCSYTALSLGALHSERTWILGDQYNSYRLEVGYNYIRNYMMELGDGAAIYLSGYNAHVAYEELFNKVHDNYIVMSNKTGSGLGYLVVGIYFDAASSNWHCYNNVIAAQSYGAVEGEDEGFDMTDPAVEKYVRELRLRRAASTYIYLQLHVAGQITHNILCEGNYIINVRATSPDKQREEVYKTYLGEERNVTEKNTHYIGNPDVLPPLAEDVIYAAGCYGHTGDPYLLYDNNY